MATCNIWNSDNDFSKSLKTVCTETNKQTKLWYLVIISREKKKKKQTKVAKSDKQIPGEEISIV